MDISASPMMGRWRIFEADLWDRDFLDLVEPAYILFAERESEFAFGAVTGAMDCRYGNRNASFTWVGNEEMDETSGSGEAFLEEDNTLAIFLRFNNGDEAELKANKL